MQMNYHFLEFYDLLWYSENNILNIPLQSACFYLAILSSILA